MFIYIVSFLNNYKKNCKYRYLLKDYFKYFYNLIIILSISNNLRKASSFNFGHYILSHKMIIITIIWNEGSGQVHALFSRERKLTNAKATD